MSIDEFLARLKMQFDADPMARPSFEAIIEHWITKRSELEPDSLDSIAARLAYGYSTKEFIFDFCSVLMRRLKDYSAQRIWPPFFWEVFVAFDAGEFYHNDSEPRDIDPSELHTRPMIDAIVCRFGKNESGKR